MSKFNGVSPQLPTCRRNGVTLMEVLLSIGVTFIGLMGAASLFPVASFQLQKGTQLERTAYVGKRAMRELQMRGIADASNWLYDGSPVTVRNTYCLDPRGVAEGLPPSFAGSTGLMPPVISRISLRRDRDSLLPMSMALADSFFVVNDELDFEIPSEATQPPVQSLLRTGGQGRPVKRVARGQFSWMAFWVPKLATDLFDVWIVILNRRLVPSSGDESVAKFFPNQSGNIYVTGGSEIEIEAPASLVNNAVLRAEQGEWIMLTETVPSYQDNIPYQRVAWYRIIGAEEPRSEDNGDSMRRYVTVSGPDWFDDEDGETYVVHMKGVVAVYHKTILIQ